ncbi:MAG: hypothetical protein JWN08_3046 [Frankiales bacterium]|nr:hypothetical protein [Frankiales bacterium]
MSRRTLTLLLASLLALALTGAAVGTPVPYVALGPGPTYNTLGDVEGTPVIAITGTEVFPTDGHLDLTTVGVDPSLTLLEALRGWFDRDLAVVPRDVVYPPDKTDEQVNEENAASMVASQSSAVTAAARQLGFDTFRVTVREVAAGSPSDGRLEVGDVLLTVDSAPVADEAGLRAAITAAGVGAALEVGYQRGGTRGVATVTTRSSGGDEPRPVIGITPAEAPADLPFEVDITLEEVGGPSAGLMFALGILDKLGKASLTGGKYVAGTGEITSDGTVGPIGGITQKLIAARGKGADVFLVPQDNCAEASVRPPSGLLLLRVASLSDALTGLEAVRRGTAPELCSAP